MIPCHEYLVDAIVSAFEINDIDMATGWYQRDRACCAIGALSVESMRKGVPETRQGAHRSNAAIYLQVDDHVIHGIICGWDGLEPTMGYDDLVYQQKFLAGYAAGTVAYRRVSSMKEGA